jgi:hypothetical protein
VVAGLEDLPVLEVRDRTFDRGAQPVERVVVGLLLVGEFTTGWSLSTSVTADRLGDLSVIAL